MGKCWERQGAIWQNPRKMENKHPDFLGEARWKGELISVAGWVHNHEGLQVIRLTLREKEEKEE